jgi:hypothetical protein
MREMLSDPYCIVGADPGTWIVRFVRTGVPYPSLEDFELQHEKVARVFDRLGRRKHALLVDFRRAPMNNDPRFEEAAARARSVLIRDFARVAVLVQTAIGALQVKRHAREDGLECLVFQDEPGAVEYLSQADMDPAPTSRVKDLAASGPFAHLGRLGRRER